MNLQGLKKCWIATVFLAFLLTSGFLSSAQEREFYQLRIYQFENAEQVTKMDQFLSATYLAGLKKQGLNNIGVFKNRPSDEDTSRLVYILIPFASLDQFQSVDSNLQKTTASTPPYLRMSSILLKAFADMPTMKPSPLAGDRSARIYELRSYESATEAKYQNKVDMFNAGGEVALFKKLGFNAVFYGEVISGASMPNLMYMTTFSDQQSRDEHWQAFGASPEWTKLKSMPKYQDNVSHADILMLYPTLYSDY